MIPVPTGVRPWIAAGNTDMRCGMNGLSLLGYEGLMRPRMHQTLALQHRWLASVLRGHYG